MGGHATCSSQAREGDEVVDAEMSRRVLTLMQSVDARLTQSGGQVRCDKHLELALLYFFKCFRQAYIGEQHGMPSASDMEAARRKGESAPAPRTVKRQMYRRMFELMALGDHGVVIDMLMRKVVNNLKYWADNTQVVELTLSVFQWIGSGYGSGKFLLSLGTVQYMLANHTSAHFPFLSVPEHTRLRTLFYKNVARLLYLGDYNETMYDFMEPICRALAQLAASVDFRNQQARDAVIGVCRDLRGICISTTNRRTYGLFFDCLYPRFLPVLQRAIEAWWDTPPVVNAVLKFMVRACLLLLLLLLLLLFSCQAVLVSNTLV